MSLTDELKAIDPDEFMEIARKIVNKHNYSDHDLKTKCAKHRRKYPVYDLLCKNIENNGKPLLEETLLMAIGSEQILRTLIVIGEELEKKKTH